MNVILPQTDQLTLLAELCQLREHIQRRSRERLRQRPYMGNSRFRQP